MKTKQLVLNLFRVKNQLELFSPKELSELEKTQHPKLTTPKLPTEEFTELKYSEPNKPAKKRFFYF